MVRRKKRAAQKAQGNKVVAEFPIVLLPIHKRLNASGSLNRLQFPQRRYWLRSQTHLPQQQQRCFFSFKKNVKQLRVAFLRDDFEKMNDCENSLTTAEIAQRCDVFTGEGFSQHQILNYTLGFIQNEKLFLLPIEQSYEMNFTNMPKPEGGCAGTAEAPQDNETPAASSGTSSLGTPVRIRFARAETDAQKRRREQSALYKQRLIDQDRWLSLNLQTAEVSDFCKSDVSKFEKANDSRPQPTYTGSLRLKNNNTN